MVNYLVSGGMVGLLFLAKEKDGVELSGRSRGQMIEGILILLFVLWLISRALNHDRG
jgi:Na+-translocating ferredoxin:NAD+ oxidoreductase RnfD subunit